MSKTKDTPMAPVKAVTNSSWREVMCKGTSQFRVEQSVVCCTYILPDINRFVIVRRPGLFFLPERTVTGFIRMEHRSKTLESLVRIRCERRVGGKGSGHARKRLRKLGLGQSYGKG